MVDLPAPESPVNHSVSPSSTCTCPSRKLSHKLYHLKGVDDYEPLTRGEPGQVTGDRRPGLRVECTVTTWNKPEWHGGAGPEMRYPRNIRTCPVSGENMLHV